MGPVLSLVWSLSNAITVTPSVMSDPSNTKSFMSPTLLKFQLTNKTHIVYKYQSILPVLTDILKYNKISD